jgi:hypothetical protein
MAGLADAARATNYERVQCRMVADEGAVECLNVTWLCMVTNGGYR